MIVREKNGFVGRRTQPEPACLEIEPNFRNFIKTGSSQHSSAVEEQLNTLTHNTTQEWVSLLFFS
jgi:hypothetical protein